MPTFDLDKKYCATLVTYIGYSGFMAKGAIYILATGKAIKIIGKTQQVIEKAAHKKAREIHQTIIKAKPNSATAAKKLNARGIRKGVS
jgi:hypothetical protein